MRMTAILYARACVIGPTASPPLHARISSNYGTNHNFFSHLSSDKLMRGRRGQCGEKTTPGSACRCKSVRRSAQSSETDRQTHLSPPGLHSEAPQHMVAGVARAGEGVLCERHGLLEQPALGLPVELLLLVARERLSGPALCTVCQQMSMVVNDSSMLLETRTT